MTHSKSPSTSSPLINFGNVTERSILEAGVKKHKASQGPLLAVGRPHSPPPPNASLRRLSIVALRLLASILDLHVKLMALSSLAPSPATTATFERLVSFVTHPSSYHFSGVRSIGPIGSADVKRVLALPEVKTMQHDIQQKSSQGESLLEQHWAKLILQDRAKVDDFPYIQNYRDLARLEYNAVAGLGGRPRNVLFLGSGPLPLSSLLFAHDHMEPLRYSHREAPWSVVNIDIQPEANKLASGVIEKVAPSLKNSIEFITCDASSVSKYIDLGKFDTLFLAALVGEDTRAKRKILQKVVPNLRPGTLVILRSANGLRELLYPRIDLRRLLQPEGNLPLEALAEMHPHNDIVNSIIVLRRTQA